MKKVALLEVREMISRQRRLFSLLWPVCTNVFRKKLSRLMQKGKLTFLTTTLGKICLTRANSLLSKPFVYICFRFLFLSFSL